MLASLLACACGDAGAGATDGADTTETDTFAPEQCPEDQVDCDGRCIDPPGSTLAAIQAEVFVACTFQGCHGRQAPKEALELSDVTTSFANLVGVPSVQRPDWARVEPGDPGRSYLVNKLRGDDLSPASDGSPGGVMPLGGVALCEAQIAAVEAWIAAGAAAE